MRLSRFSRSRDGFTLVELLVVIAIIAVLAGVALAAYTSALSRARTAACQNNLRAIGIGLLSFAADNDDCLPESGSAITYNSTDPTTGKNGWTQQLEPYMGGKVGPTGINKIYTCPDSSTRIASNVNYSYFSGAHAAFSQNWGTFAAVRLSRLHNPSAYIMGGDIAFPISFTATDCDKDNYTQDPLFNNGAITSTDNGVTGTGGTIPIHNGSVNVLFADGHIQNCKGFDALNMTTVYQGPGAKYDPLYPQ